MNFPFTKSEYFRRNIHPKLARLPFYAFWLLKRKSYLKTTGWFRSFKNGKSINSEGRPIPWFTYGAIEILKTRLPEDVIVFEYGCGFGTKWWAEHAREADAVEHDRKWYEMISKNIPVNVRLKQKPLNGEYENSIAESGKRYDVVIIDGKNRMICAKAAIHHLSKRGIIIYDDTDRKKSAGAVQFFKDEGFKHLPFVGFSPIEFMKCETSIFYKDGNLLSL